MNARPLGAACAGAAGAALLHGGGAPWPAAALAGFGAATFAAWRTVPGAWAGFGVVVAAATAGWPGAAALAESALRPAWPWLAALELFGLATIVAVRQVRQPPHLSRRLLGAWLASTGALLLGLVLSGEDGAAPSASALVAGGLLYKLGVVPAYAWAPMLLRHPDRRIARAGIAAFALSLAVLLGLWPLAPGESAAAFTVLALCGTAVPWATWKARGQWRSDRSCALTYAAVAGMGSLLIVLLGLSSILAMG